MTNKLTPRQRMLKRLLKVGIKVKMAKIIAWLASIDPAANDHVLSFLAYCDQAKKHKGWCP